MGRLLARTPDQLPASPRALRKALGGFHPAATGMSQKRFANVRAGVTQALGLVGATSKPKRPPAV